MALTLNASLPFGDAVLSASYFDRDFRYEADATDYEFRFNQNCDQLRHSSIYDFGGDPRGFATNHESARITTIEARLASPGDSRKPLGLAGRRVLQPGEGPHGFRQLRPRLRGYAVIRVFQRLRRQSDTAITLAPTDRWFLGRYDTELDQIAVFGELSFDVTENFTITAGGRWFDYDRKFVQHQEQPEGFFGHSRCSTTTRKPARTARSPSSTSPTSSIATTWSTPLTRKDSASAAATR